MADPVETEWHRAQRRTRRKTWFWVAFFVVLGVGGRLAFLIWGLP